MNKKLQEFIKSRVAFWVGVGTLGSLVLTVIAQWSDLEFPWFISDQAVAVEISIVDEKFTKLAGEQQDYSRRNELQLKYMQAKHATDELGEVRYKREKQDTIELAQQEARLENQLKNLSRQICYLEGSINCNSS